MATASPTENRVYLYRLLTLNIDIGTTVIRNLIDDKCSNTPLTTILARERRVISNLRANKTITKVQFDLLYPQSGSPPTTSDFDLTLGICLLRNLKHFGLNPMYTWDVIPQPGDTSLEADICRLRMYRNELTHISYAAGIQETAIISKWADIEGVLHRLNGSLRNPVPNLRQIIDEYKTGPLDPEVEKEINKKRRKMEKIEEKIEIEVQNIKKAVADVTKDVHEMKGNVDTVSKEFNKLRVYSKSTHRSIDELEKQWKPEEIPPELFLMNETSVELYKRALAEGSEKVHNIRLMIVGHFGVGKTTLTKRLFGEDVDLNNQESTEGIDVHVRKCKVSLEDGSWHVLDEDVRKNDIYKRLARLFKANSAGRTTEPNYILKRSPRMKKMLQGLYPEDEHTFRSSTPEVCPPIPSETKDDIFQDLKEIVAQAKDFNRSDRTTEKADLSVWDFAGQFAFYSTHQVFLSRRAIYLLVINLSKSIDDEVPDRCFMDSRGSRHCPVTDFVEFWLNSIHEYCGGPSSEKIPVILVGTFADKIDQTRKQELAKSYFKKLKRKLVKCETFEYLAEEMMIIDNSIVDPNMDTLKTTIWKLACGQSYWGELIPATYITLEKTLMKLRNEGLKVLLKTDLREINKAMPVPIASDEGLDVFLNFHHETGYLLYFNDTTLKDYVLLQPQWLIDAFRCLITAEQFCKGKEKYTKWMEFDEKGILTRGLIDIAWKEAADNLFKHKEVLLLFMERLGLIAKPFGSTESGSLQTKADHYFAPCVLKQEPPRDILETKNTSVKTSTSRLCFTTTSRFIPSAVFNRLLAACLTKWNLFEQDEKPAIFCGCGVFKLDETHLLYVHFFDNMIQIWITRFSRKNAYPGREICEEVKNFIISYLQTNVRMTSTIDVYIKCPQEQALSNKAFFKNEVLLEKSEVLCSFHGEAHHITTSDLTKYWYGNEQVHGKDADGSIEINSLDRLPTDIEMNRIAQRIGKDYQSLGRELGLTQPEIERLEMDHGTSLNRIHGMLHQWRSKALDEATFRQLKQAMHAIGMEDIFCVCGDTP